MKTIQIGVIGCGQRSAIAIHAHRPELGINITCCCDTDSARLQAFSEKFSATPFCDYQEMLKQPLDAVFILTPDYLHSKHAIAALKAGCSVYLEKPMATTVGDCNRLIEEARKQQKLLYLGHNMRHLQVVVTMKRLIEKGEIGEVKSIWCRHFVGHGGDFYFRDWHAEKQYSNSLLLQKAVHDFDVMNWLAESYPVRVQALGSMSLYANNENRRPRGKLAPLPEVNRAHWPPESLTELNPDIDVEDLSLVNYQLANGVLVAYQQCHFTPDYWRNYTVIGTKGRLENYGDFLNAEIHLWNERCSYQRNGHEVIPVPVNEGSHGGADEKIVGEFLDCLQQKAQPSIAPEEARNAVAVACLATQSLRNNGAVKKFDWD